MVSMSPYVVGRPAVQSCLFSWWMPRSFAKGTTANRNRSAIFHNTKQDKPSYYRSIDTYLRSGTELATLMNHA